MILDFPFLANNPTFNLNSTYKSPEINMNIYYAQKANIYFMGVFFYYLCNFQFPRKEVKGNNIYPKEMENIIELMLKNEYERPNS